MFWNREHNEIKTEFVDSTTGEIIGRTTMPTDQIPETFEIDTTLDIGSDKFTVIDAIPRKKQDFAKTGKLRVLLRKVDTVPVDDLLYSLPTIENTYFPGKEIPTEGHFLKIHADDWRQREFLSRKYLPQISEELAAVQSILEHHMKGDFFKTIHVRSKIEFPLSDRVLRIDDVFDAFGLTSNYDGFEDDQGVQSAKGFSFDTLQRTSVFGVLSEDRVIATLCLQSYEVETRTIEAFCQKHELVFVDWIRRATIQ